MGMLNQVGEWWEARMWRRKSLNFETWRDYLVLFGCGDPWEKNLVCKIQLVCGIWRKENKIWSFEKIFDFCIFINDKIIVISLNSLSGIQFNKFLTEDPLNFNSKMSAHENAIKIKKEKRRFKKTCWCNLSCRSFNNCRRQRLIAFFCFSLSRFIAHWTIYMNCTPQFSWFFLSARHDHLEVIRVQLQFCPSGDVGVIKSWAVLLDNPLHNANEMAFCSRTSCKVRS